MANRRYKLDLAIPETIPPALLKKPTPAQITAIGKMTWAEIIVEMIRRLKSYSNKINAGISREEDTTIARWHICRHADNMPCDEEQDI